MIGGRKEPWEPIDDNWGYKNYHGLFEVNDKLRWVTTIKNNLVYLNNHKLKGSIDISSLNSSDITIINDEQIKIEKNNKTVYIRLVDPIRRINTQTKQKHLTELLAKLKSMCLDRSTEGSAAAEHP